MAAASADSLKGVANALLEQSYAIFEAPTAVLDVATAILREGATFFALPLEQKRATASDVDDLEGYRGFGAELDPETGLKDLSEGFRVWWRNADSDRVRRWGRKSQLHRVMASGLEPFSELAEQILLTLKAEVGTGGGNDGAPISIRRLSYLQQNFYRPAEHADGGRTNVMETHEDGHLLTIVKPNAPGLIVSAREMIAPPTRDNPRGCYEPKGNFVEIEVGAREVVVIPSSPTCLMTGGLVRPLWHGVRNKGDRSRQSLMLFVNPDPAIPLEPWVKNDRFTGADVHEVVEIMSGQYGQAPLSKVHSCAS